MVTFGKKHTSAHFATAKFAPSCGGQAGAARSQQGSSCEGKVNLEQLEANRRRVAVRGVMGFRHAALCGWDA
jgi:hypothetical protein